MWGIREYRPESKKSINVMNKTEQQVYNQTGAIINTLYPSAVVHARIFTEDQRQQINQLIQSNYLPHHTSVGRGNATTKHWNLETYKGKFGEGYKLITTSPYSSNFNHITYFIKEAI